MSGQVGIFDRSLGTNDLSASKRVPSIQVTRPLMGI